MKHHNNDIFCDFCNINQKKCISQDKKFMKNYRYKDMIKKEYMKNEIKEFYEN